MCGNFGGSLYEEVEDIVGNNTDTLYKHCSPSLIFGKHLVANPPRPVRHIRIYLYWQVEIFKINGLLSCANCDFTDLFCNSTLLICYARNVRYLNVAKNFLHITYKSL